MKAKDLRERSASDLQELNKSLPKELFNAKMKNFTNQLDDTSSLGKSRKDIARVKTLLRQKELALQPVAGSADASGSVQK